MKRKRRRRRRKKRRRRRRRKRRRIKSTYTRVIISRKLIPRPVDSRLDPSAV